LKRGVRKPGSFSGSKRTKWRGRQAIRLSNGVVELTALNGGGHVAEFCFAGGAAQPSANVLWESPWEGAAPGTTRARRLAAKYGPKGVGEFLASYTGHALCLDYFGMPSADEVKRGLPLHGEAASANWRVIQESTRNAAACARWRAELPAAGLAFEREIELHKGDSVAVFREHVTNQRGVDHYFHWVQHVTLGTPLLDPECSQVFISGTRAKPWPLGYEGKSLVSADREFRWPYAPREKGGEADLSIPFRERGTGFVVSVLLDARRKVQFVATLNWRLGLIAGYVFRGEDFPWVAVWEENCAREHPPWNGTTQARGMEFGTTPMPIGKEATFLAGKLFDRAGWKRIPARATQEVVYAALLAEVPKSWRGIRDIQVDQNGLVIIGTGAGETVTIDARGIPEWKR
jgi:hypothetical protein